MEKPENPSETDIPTATPETANPDPEIQEIIEKTVEAMSLPIGYIDGLIDAEKFAAYFPCESGFNEHQRAEAIRKRGVDIDGRPTLRLALGAIARPCGLRANGAAQTRPDRRSSNAKTLNHQDEEDDRPEHHPEKDEESAHETAGYRVFRVGGFDRLKSLVEKHSVTPFSGVSFFPEQEAHELS